MSQSKAEGRGAHGFVDDGLGEVEAVGGVGEEDDGGFCFGFEHDEGFEGAVVAPVPEVEFSVVALNAPA